MTTVRPNVDHQSEIGRLVGAAAAGDQAAWNALVARFGVLVYATIRGFRISSSEAEDVNQTVWLRLVEHIGRLRDPERVGAWLAVTTRNECLRTLRLADRQVLTGDHATFDRPDPGASLEAGLVLSERDAALWRAFLALPERCRQLLRVVIADPPASYEDVAARVGLSVASVGPTRARCLQRLRTSAERSGIDPGTDDSY
jgi:RNA polymerase sigma factor (sigma-70 family)